MEKRFIDRVVPLSIVGRLVPGIELRRHHTPPTCDVKLRVEGGLVCEILPGRPGTHHRRLYVDSKSKPWAGEGAHWKDDDTAPMVQRREGVHLEEMIITNDIEFLQCC